MKQRKTATNKYSTAKKIKHLQGNAAYNAKHAKKGTPFLHVRIHFAWLSFCIIELQIVQVCDATHVDKNYFSR